MNTGRSTSLPCHKLTLQTTHPAPWLTEVEGLDWMANEEAKPTGNLDRLVKAHSQNGTF